MTATEQFVLDVSDFTDEEDDIDLGEELDDLDLSLDADEEINSLVRMQKNLRARVRQIDRREIPRINQDFKEFRTELAKLLTNREITAEERTRIKSELGNLNLRVNRELKTLEARQIDLARRQAKMTELFGVVVNEAKRARVERQEIRADIEQVNIRVDGHENDLQRLTEHGVQRSQQIVDLQARTAQLDDDTEILAKHQKVLAESQESIMNRVLRVEEGVMQMARAAASSDPIEQSLDPDADFDGITVSSEPESMPTVRVRQYTPAPEDTTEITEIMPTRQPRRIGHKVVQAAVVAAAIVLALIVPIMDFGSKNPPAHASSDHADEPESNYQVQGMDITLPTPTAEPVPSNGTSKESEICQKHHTTTEWLLMWECSDNINRRCALASQDATGTYMNCEVYKIK